MSTVGPALENHYQFVLWLIPTLDKFPRSQKFLLGDRMQQTAIAVLEDLIAATYSRERRGYLTQANMGLEKLRFMFRLCKDLALTDLRRYEFAARSLNETGKLVGGWMKADTQAQAPQAAG